MVRVLPTENTKDTKIKMHMKSENIEPQNTQKNAKKRFVFFVSSVGKNNTLRQPSGSSGSSGDIEKRFVFFV